MSPVKRGTVTAPGEVSRETICWAIKYLTDRNGFPPTYRELRGLLGLTLSTIAWHVRRLEQEGAVSRVPGFARSLRVLP